MTDDRGCRNRAPSNPRIYVLLGPPRPTPAPSRLRLGPARHTGKMVTNKGGSAMKLWRPQVAVVLLAMLLAAACAKRPAMTQTAAPPPTGAAVTATPPAPAAPVAPPAPAPPATAPRRRPRPLRWSRLRQPPRHPRGRRRRTSRSVPVLRDVFFDFDKYDDQAGCRPRARRQRRVAEVESLSAAPDRGPLRRARHQRLQPRARGAPREGRAGVCRGPRRCTRRRIVIITYGEERPVCTARNAACWAQNRRAHFLAKQP